MRLFQIGAKERSSRANKRNGRALRRLGAEPLEARELLSASDVFGAQLALADLTEFVSASPVATPAGATIDLASALFHEGIAAPTPIEPVDAPVDVAADALDVAIPNDGAGQSVVVTTASDVVSEADDVLSLREAISLAGTSGYSSTITFASSLKGKTISLSEGELTLTRSMTIDASGLGVTSADAPGLTIDAGGQSRIFNVYYSNITVAVKGMKLTGGSDDYGGAIRATGKFTLDSCVLTGNAGKYGGALYATGSSTTVTNALVYGNTATSYGAGVYLSGGGTAEIVNTTIAQNVCPYSSSTHAGGLIVFSSTVNLKNSIVASNTAGNHFDIYRNAAATVNAYNVVANFGDWTEYENVVPFYSLTETFVDAASGDYRLASTSPAIDAGATTYATALGLTKDVGGRTRAVGNSVDIGAYERTQSDPTTARRTEDYHMDFYVDTVFYDADKKMDDGDSNLCWAGAASNALWFTQWGQIAEFEDEEAVFHDAFEASFPNQGGNAYYAYQWFLDGRAYESYSGGRYYSDALSANGESSYAYSKYVSATSVSSLVAMTEQLRSGCGVTISVGWYYESSGSRKSGHALSVYGYSYNPQLLPTDPGYITKLYIADSNDYGKLSDRRDRKLRTLDLSWSDEWKMYVVDSYRYLDGCILLLDSFQNVAPRPVKYAPNAANAKNLYFFENFYSQPTFSIKCGDSTTLANNKESTLEFSFLSNAAISSGVKYEVFIDDVSYGVFSTGRISQGTNAISRSLGYFTAGSHVVRVALDSAGAIAESNEQDNFYAKTIVVEKIAIEPLATPAPRAKSTTEATATIEWEAVEGAKSYTLQYRLAGESGWTSVGIKPSLTSHTLEGLTSGATYQVQMRANGDGGKTSKSSAFSDVLTLTIPIRLAAPVASTAATNDSITVYWDADALAKSFTVQYRLSGATTWTSKNASGAVDSLTLSGLTSGATYQVQVRANGDGGKTALSSEYGAIVSIKVAPKLARPSLEFDFSTPSSIAVVWTAVDGAKSYAVQYRVVGATSWSQVGARATATSIEISGLTENEEYEIRMKANGDGGATWYSSDFSRVLTATATHIPRALPTTVPTIGEKTESAIELSWSAVEGATGYELQYKASNAEDWTSVAVASTETTLSVAGLERGTTYNFRLKALGDGETASNSKFGAIVSVATNVAPRLETPTLVFYGATETSIALRWRAIEGAKSYSLQYKAVDATSWTTIGVKATETSVEVSDLTRGGVYQFQMKANGDGGATSMSSYYGAVLSAAVDPKLFTPEIAAKQVGATMEISWTAIEGAKSYSLQYKLSSESNWASVGAQGSATSVVLEMLAPSEFYDFRLKANGDGGVTVKSSEWSDVASAKVVVKLPTPTLYLLATTEDSATIAWNAIEGAASYALYYRVAGATSWTQQRGVTAGMTSFTVPNLTNGATYEFKMKANGDGGANWYSSNESAFLSATIGQTDPIKLTTPELATTTSDAALTVSWVAIPGASSYALYYRALGETTWTQQRGITASMTSYAFTTLDPGSTYEFRMKANGDGGVNFASSDFSAVASATFVAPLSAPTLAATAISDDSIKLTWDAVANAKSYALQYKLADATSWTAVSVRATATSWTLSGLASGTYEFRMKANGDGGATCKSSPFSATCVASLSDAASFATLDETIDPTPDGDGAVQLEAPTARAFVVAHVGLTPTSQPVAFSWNTISCAKSYTVAYKSTKESSWSLRNFQSTETSYTFGAAELTPGETYEFKVRANGDGATYASSPYSAGVSKLFVGKFSPPPLSLANVGSTTATLKWGAVKGAKSYTLQYKKSDATNWTSVGAASTATTRTISGLTNGKSYDFRIQTDGDGSTCYSSDFCAAVSGSPQAPTLATPKLLLDGSTKTSIDVKWTAISGAKSYTLQYKLSTASEWTSVGVKTTETSFTVSGLTKGKSYDFRLRANGDGGATFKSSSFSGVLTAEARAKLASPSLATSATKTSITAYWDPIAGAKSYTIQYKLSTESDSAWKNAGVRATEDSYSISGLSSGKTYNLRIRANGDGGATWYSSDFSATVSVKTQPKLARPELALAGSTNSSISVQWDAISGAKSYTLQYKLSTTSEWTNVGVRSTETSYAVSGLTKGKSYDFRLRANGDGGATWLSSEFSRVLTTTVENRSLSTPSPKVASTTETSISLSWSAVANAKSYVLQYKLSTSSSWSSEISLSSSKTSHTLTGLKASTKYDFRLRAVGNGTTTFDSTFGTTSGTTKSAAQQLAAPQPTVVEVGSNSIKLSWKAVSGAKSYSIEYKLSTSSSWTTVSAGATATSKTLTGLTRGGKYNLRMRALGDGVNYKTSSYASAPTQVVAPKLSTPSLNCVGSTGSSITVGWQKVAGAKSYTIQYKLSTSSEWTSVSAGSTATSKTISGLTKGKAYDFRIRANGDGGETYLSSEFSSALRADAILKLVAPTLSASSTNAGLELSWRAVSGAASYTLQYRASGSTTWTNKGVAGTATSVVFSGLTPGSVYEFRIRANGDGGVTAKSSEFGDVISARFEERTSEQLKSPTVAVQATSINSVLVSWEQVSGATSYTLQYKRSDSSAWSSLEAGASYSSCALQGFSAGSWSFRVRANGDGVSTLSSEFSATQTIYLGLASPAPEPIEPETLPVELVPELDDDLLTALAENWRS